MPDSSTLTVRLSDELKAQLAILAGRTKRTRNFLVAEAIAAYVERELAIVEGVERGRADLRAGRVTPHEEVAREAREIIEAARLGTDRAGR
jgi:predicted transcriptional regulator